MKNCRLIIAAIAVTTSLLWSCSCYFERGNGDILTSEREVSLFSEIRAGGCADVHYHASDEYRVVVTVDSNLDKYTEVFVRNSVLHIGHESGACSFTEYRVDVYCPVLNAVSMSGSGHFSGNDVIAVSSFDANVSGSGAINVAVECKTLSATISGSGEINLSGTGHDASITLSGSGKFDGQRFGTVNTAIRLSGSGNVTVCVDEYLKATLSGSGNIRYYGNPQVDSRVSGSGQIKKK